MEPSQSIRSEFFENRTSQANSLRIWLSPQTLVRLLSGLNWPQGLTLSKNFFSLFLVFGQNIATVWGCGASWCQLHHAICFFSPKKAKKLTKSKKPSITIGGHKNVSGGINFRENSAKFGLFGRSFHPYKGPTHWSNEFLPEKIGNFAKNSGIFGKSINRLPHPQMKLLSTCSIAVKGY